MGSVLGVGAASGPVIGGLLTETFGWQAIFLFNVPVAAAAYVVTTRVNPTPPTAAASEPAGTATTGQGDTATPGGDAPGDRIANPVFAAATGVLLIGGVTTATPIVVAALAVFGLGLGTAMPNMMTAALESVTERRTASAAGVLSMSRYVGSITTSVVVSAVVTSDAAGTRTVLGLAVVAMVVALLPATRLPGRIAAGHSVASHAT